VQVSLPPDGSHESQDYDEWAHLSYPDELKPSDSASRPRTSHRTRSLHGSRSASGRRQPSRHQMIERDSMGPRARQRHRSPESPGSDDSGEFHEPYARNPHDRRWPPATQPAGYAPSASSGPSFNAYPPAPGPARYPHPSGPLPGGDQLIPFGHNNPAGQPYGPGPGSYPYGAQVSSSGAPIYPPYFAQDQAHRHPRAPAQSRIDPHNHSQPHMHPMGPHGHSPYAGSPFHHEMMPYAPNAYYNYRDPYSLVQGMVPHSYFPSYPQVPSPPQPEVASPPASTPAPAPAPPPADAAKDEAIARLEKLILDDRTEREAKEAARMAAIEREAAEAAAKAQQLAHDRKIAEEAAMLARADAEKKAAEDAAKAKEEAEKAATAAASEAAATAQATAAAAAAEASGKPAPEKKKPIKFKDAVGRKFSFPFELCSTWQVSCSRFLPSHASICE
jgi:Membrane protein involved in colicin uptake